MQQIAAASQASPLLHGQVSSLLLHPILVWVRRESHQAHSASLQVNEEKHIVGQQPLERQDFRREEVHPHQNVRSTVPVTQGAAGSSPATSTNYIFFNEIASMFSQLTTCYSSRGLEV